MKTFEQKMIERMKKEVQSTVLPMISSLQDIETIMENFKKKNKVHELIELKVVPKR